MGLHLPQSTGLTAMRTEQIEALIRPTVEALGCELWGLQVLQSKQTLLRLYIEKAEGVGIEDCEQVSRQVSRLLDVEDPFSREYTLEVSSPGMDRPLFTLEQFARYQGEQVNLKLRLPFKGQRNFKGQLSGTEGDEIVLRVEDEELLLPLESIEKANVVPVFEGEPKSAGKKAKPKQRSSGEDSGT